MNPRFTRLPAGEIGGLKLASRSDVNRSISQEQADDVGRFRDALARRFGAPDTNTDADFSYVVRDEETGVVVRAYSAQSGPAYGGMPDECFVDFAGSDYR